MSPSRGAVEDSFGRFTRDDQSRSVGPSKALTALGGEPSLQIIRSVFQGRSRFSRLRGSLGISDAVLAKQLRELTER